MRELNYVEGRNLVIRPAFGDGKQERLPALGADLVSAKVDVIVTTGGPATVAAQRATSWIPIVMMVVSDPVAQGLVASLARPGGNVTGLTSLVPGLSQKYVELLHEVLPSARRCAVIVDPHTARDLLDTGVRGGRGPDDLQRESGRLAATRGDVRRQDPSRCQPGGSSHRAAHEI
jgi:ABC-type uncharacterized transport system substrate-binding protein